ncbi:MAG: alginate lyase family protein [Pyrinomonadaceae bacterium]
MRLDRLKNATLGEVRVRASQACAALLERRSWSQLAKLPADEQLLAALDSDGTGHRSIESIVQRFRESISSRFFASFTDKAATIDQLRKRWPACENEIVLSAEKICEGKFDLLGYRNLSFGQPIDWQLEPVSGKRAPLIHWSRLNFLDADAVGDKKITWELNRHQHFITLGQAYWLTGNNKYCEVFAEHLEDWMEKNPPKLGINWASSLEVAFRSISWLWAYQFFKDSPVLSNRLVWQLLKFLYVNGRHLETYLSTYFSPNTHLTGEGLGLFYLGTLLPEFKDAQRWRSTGQRILLDQLAVHVKPDGVYFEHSSYYQRYTADFYLHFCILSSRNKNEVVDQVSTNLGALLEHLMFIMRPDGTTPFIGDDDGGRLIKLDPNPVNDFRGTLSTGSVVLKSGMLKYAASDGAAEILWLLGVDGVHEFDSLKPAEPAKQSAAFKDGGYYVMRDGWTADANYLVFDAGPHGFSNGGHAHADVLSFELAGYGRSWLIDPGTCTYTGSQKDRDWFRGSQAHNTLTVDGESSSEPDGPFSWKSTARHNIRQWIDQPMFNYVAATHDGYLRLRKPVNCSREILFLKNNYWVMRDVTESGGEHEFDLWFHFNVGTSPECEFQKGLLPQVIVRDNSSALKIVSVTPEGIWSKAEGWMSTCYGTKESAPVWKYSARGSGRREFITFFLPFGAHSSDSIVTEIDVVNGLGFAVTCEDRTDLVIVSKGGLGQYKGWRSDFEWAVVRYRDSQLEDPDEILLLNGTTAELNRKALLKSQQQLHYALLRRIDKDFVIDTAADSKAGAAD